jgi:hypothetical protein
MLRHERLEAALGFLRQGVVGRPFVGKFRMPADRESNANKATTLAPAAV